MSTTMSQVEATSSQGERIHEVKQVYIYIPAELSATGFELKIAGSVCIIRKGAENKLAWDPEELSYQDVACLYSAEADGWTVIDDDLLDPPEIVDSHEYRYPSSGRYPKMDLKAPDPIIKTGGKKKEEKIKYTKEAPKPNTSSNPMKLKESPVTFPLSQLKCIRESSLKDGVGTLTFFLRDGKELPTLYFHDGGISGLIEKMRRFLYLVRDGKDSHLLRVEDNPVVIKSRQIEGRRSPSSQQVDILKGVEGLIQVAVLEVGKRVRHGFRNSRDLLDERPCSDKDEEEISTITCHDLTSKDKHQLPDPDASLITDFQLVTDLRGRLPPRPPIRPRLSPLSRDEWESYRQIDGQISKEKEAEFRGRVFAGGVEPTLRREVWKYLLGYFRFDATDVERMEEQKLKESQYEIMKKQWQSFLPEQVVHFRHWRDNKNLIEKDVIRTDRELEWFHSVDSPRLKQLQDILNTYVMYNFDLGYVQGMSDLLSPLLVVIENEADTFWCFVGLMNMVQQHFEFTQENMRHRIKQLRALLNVSDPVFYQYLREKDSSNLYFAFRWLLVDFKREFNFPDLMSLWEVFWTYHLSLDYPLFFALAIIDMEKDKLIDPNFDFSDIIAHINGLSKNMLLDELLQHAESICRQIAAVQGLPAELQSLFNQPFPQPHPLSEINQS